MKTITLLNDMSGVGKTTLAHTLACGLARDGQTVLAIDTDPLGTLTHRMGFQQQAQDIWDRLIQGVPSNHVGPDVRGRLFVLPGSSETRPFSAEDGILLHKRLQDLKGHFNYVIIDTPSSTSLLSVMVSLASHSIIIPTLLDSMALRGLKQSIQVIQDYARFRAARRQTPIQLLSIVPTMVRLDTTDHSANLLRLMASGLPVIQPLHDRSAWSEAANTQRSLFAHDGASDAAKDADMFVHQVKVAMGLTAV